MKLLKFKISKNFARNWHRFYKQTINDFLFCTDNFYQKAQKATVVDCEKWKVSLRFSFVLKIKEILRFLYLRKETGYKIKLSKSATIPPWDGNSVSLSWADLTVT